MVKESLKDYFEPDVVLEYPDSYEIKNDIKSPISTLYYNMTTIFEDDYPAKMPKDFARDMILWYSRPGDRVWDGCAGSCTVPLMAQILHRNGIGSDVNPKAIALGEKHAKRYNLQPDLKVANAKTSHPLEIDLVLSSLPFGLNIIGDKNHYSDENEDISNCETYDDFLKNAKLIIENYYNSLKPNGIMVLDSRDRFDNGKTIFLSNEFWKIAREVGFVEITRYHYMMIPYRQMTFKDKEADVVKGMVATMDCDVYRRPADTKMENFS